MSDQLHRFLPALLLVAAFSAHAADLPASELLKVADDALQAGTITQLEHRQTVAWIKARPCSGIDHALGAARKTSLEAAISRQEGGKTIAVYQALSYRGWHIVSSNARPGRPALPVFPGRPDQGQQARDSLGLAPRASSRPRRSRTGSGKKRPAFPPVWPIASRGT
ncbi:hypothetical protein LP420_31285 [Massilia sp. B-10]|nr:hypothetical protein LP420_31285 [Massilia sp. B-10]